MLLPRVYAPLPGIRGSRYESSTFYDTRCVFCLIISLPPPIRGFIVNRAIPRHPKRYSSHIRFLISRVPPLLCSPSSMHADGKIGLYETGSANLFAQLFEKRRFNNGVILSLSLSFSRRKDFARNPYEFENKRKGKQTLFRSSVAR